MLGEGLRAGLRYMGIETRACCFVEREAYPASVLAARMEEGSLDPAPVWSDLLTFDAGRWAGAVDGIVAGFPCQDLSLAGRRAGLDGKRSGLFFDILDIAHDCGAWFLFLENVSGIASATASVVDEAEGELEERAAARVLGELAERGWNAEWLTLSASDVGASHGRERWFCFAWREQMDDATGPRCDGTRQRAAADRKGGECLPGSGCSDVAYAERAERREVRPPGVGSKQGNDTGWPEADGRLGITDEALGDTQCSRWSPSRCGHEEHPGSELEPGCVSMGNSRLQHQHLQQRPEGAEPARAVGEMANTGSEGFQGSELGRALHGNRGGEETHGPVEQLRRPLFAPGPADERWRELIASQPWLAPALSIEEQHDAQAAFAAAQSTVRGAPDGVAARLDFDARAQRLKCIGNGVVALQAATAFVVLARRAGLKVAPL